MPPCRSYRLPQPCLYWGGHGDCLGCSGLEAGRYHFPEATTAAEKPSPWRDDHGRLPLPDLLERREVVQDLAEVEKMCPCCGQPRACIGELTAEQLDLEPVKFSVRRTVK
ncbi:MAG: IS66 family transposase zinc-finger binding domain-containing protein [Gemmataceae bacterium]